MASSFLARVTVNLRSALLRAAASIRTYMVLLLVTHCGRGGGHPKRGTCPDPFWSELPMKIRVIVGLIVALVIATAAVGQDKTPSQLYGQLFEDVQMQGVFPDGKTFVDAVPHDAPTIVMQRYQDER